MKSKQGKPNETNGTERRRGRPKTTVDTEQKDRIIRVAWTLFLERGYGRTTMSEVATTAGMSLSTIYRLFPGKTDLFSALVSLHRHSMLALPGDYDDCSVIDALMKIFQIEIDPEADRERHALMTMFIGESRQFPELEPILLEQGPLQTHALLAEWLEHQRKLGRITFPDSGTAAKMLMDIIFGAAASKNHMPPEWPGSTNRAAYVRDCLTIVMEGLRPRDA